MPSGTSPRARCSRANRGSSITSTVRRWPSWRRRSSASGGSPRRRRIFKWHAPVRPPPACPCWPCARASLSMPRIRPIARRPPSRAPEEHVAMARALNRRSSVRDARIHVERALRAGDSTAGTLLLYGELLVSSGQLRDAVRAYGAAARDSAARPLAIYRRARVLVRLGDSTALSALSGFAARYPTDSAAPGALYILGDMNDGRDDWVQAGRWYGELIKRYPADARASLARFRLAAHAEATGNPDSAASLYQAEI